MSEDKKRAEEHKIAHKKKKLDVWKVTSFVLIAFIIVAGLFIVFSGVSKNKVGNIASAYVASQLGYDNEVQGIKSHSKDLYEVSLVIEGNVIPVYITKNGNSLFSGFYDLSDFNQNGVSPSNNNPVSTDVPKSDKPEIELFLWAYCPYGVTAQSPLAEVANLLKGSANFKAVMYHDGHGAYEKQQNMIQECIQVVSPDKYWDYATLFVDEIYPTCGATRDIDCDKTESVRVMKSLGIDSDAVLSCVQTQGQALFDADKARAQALGVQGSPTLVINGVIVNAARNAEAFKSSVCSAFNNAPELCAEALSSAGATAAGNC